MPLRSGTTGRAAFSSVAILYGIKPLYIADDRGTFRFASQVKALLAGAGVSLDPEPAGIVGFHLFGSVPEPFTLYREVCALPAGIRSGSTREVLAIQDHIIRSRLS